MLQDMWVKLVNVLKSCNQFQHTVRQFANCWLVPCNVNDTPNPMYNAVPQLSVNTPPQMNECCDQSCDIRFIWSSGSLGWQLMTFPGPMLQANCAVCVRWRPRWPLLRLTDVKTWNLSKCPSAQEPVEVHPSKPHIKSAALFEILAQKFASI